MEKSYLNKIRKMEEVPSFVENALSVVKYNKRVDALKKKGAIKFSEIGKNFDKVSWDIYRKNSESDLGSIWVKEKIKNANGEEEDWLVVYTDESDRIIRQVKASLKKEKDPSIKKTANVEDMMRAEFFHIPTDYDPEPEMVEEGEKYPEGYYYWYCQIGCLPDSEPIGPFESEEEAIEDWKEQVEEFKAQSGEGEKEEKDQLELFSKRNSKKISYTPGTIVQINIPSGNLYERYHGKIGEVTSAVPDRSKVVFKDMPSMVFEDKNLKSVAPCSVCNSNVSLQMIKKIGKIECEKCKALYTIKQLEKNAKNNKINKKALRKVAIGMGGIRELLSRLFPDIKLRDDEAVEASNYIDKRKTRGDFESEEEMLKDWLMIHGYIDVEEKETSMKTKKKMGQYLAKEWIDNIKREIEEQKREFPNRPELAKELLLTAFEDREARGEMSSVGLEKAKELLEELFKTSSKKAELRPDVKTLSDPELLSLVQRPVESGMPQEVIEYLKEAEEEFYKRDIKLKDIPELPSWYSKRKGKKAQNVIQTLWVDDPKDLRHYFKSLQSPPISPATVEKEIEPETEENESEEVEKEASIRKKEQYKFWKDIPLESLKGHIQAKFDIFLDNDELLELRNYLSTYPKYTSKDLDEEIAKWLNLQGKKEASKKAYRVVTETCPKCGSEMTLGASHIAEGESQWECHNCGYVEQAKRASKKISAKIIRYKCNKCGRNFETDEEVSHCLYSDCEAPSEYLKKIKFKKEEPIKEELPEEEKEASIKKAQEEKFEEPDEGDYIIYDSGRLGSLTSVGIVEGKFLGEFKSRDEAEDAIWEDMRRHNWYPDVWYQDDHGGLTLTTIEKEASIKKEGDGLEVLRGGGGGASSQLEPMGWSVKETRKPTIPEKVEEEKEIEPETEDVGKIHVVVDPSSKDVHVSFEDEEEKQAKEIPTEKEIKPEETITEEEPETEDVSEEKEEEAEEPISPVVF